jgi:hypothetical protein
MKNKKYHPVGTIPKISPCRNNSKNITLSEQFQKYHPVGTIPKISHCRNNSKNKISKDAKSIISSH